jgi:phage FluMu gp28-like protein
VQILEHPLRPYQIEWLKLPQYRINNDGKKVATTSILEKSRRIGGTFATSLKIIFGACGIDPSNGTDTKPMDYYFASATHRQSKEVIEECADIASQLAKHDARFEHRASKLSIEFIHPKTRIVAIPASPRSIRGSTGGLVLDEICFMQDFPAIWKAAKAVAFSNIKRPEGYPVFLISTPWAVGTLQHEIMCGIGDGYKGFQRMQVSYERALMDGFPGPSPEEVRAEFGDDAYMVEFMLEWLAIGVTYFPLPLLEKSKIDIIPDEVMEEKYISGKTILEGDLSGCPRKFGIDLGLTHDLSVVTEIAEKNGLDIVVNQTVVRGVGAHELGDIFIKYMEDCDGPISKIRVDRGTIGRAAYDKIEQHFGIDLVEPFDGHIKRQISHCKNLKRLLETGKIKVASQFVDRFSGRKNSSTTTFIELNKIGLELTTAGNVTVKTPRDMTGHCDRAWSLLIAVGRTAMQEGAIITPEQAIIPGYSIYNPGSLVFPRQDEGFLESMGIHGFLPIPRTKC